MISAKVVCHSTYDGADVNDELITLEVEFHRWILAEINTHRVLSRNYQSSRAVPTEKLLEQVRQSPAVPVSWGKNQRGMVAEVELDSEDQEFAERDWRQAARYAVAQAEMLLAKGVHKQIVNRLLEPFMWTRGVITATRGAWESVFVLRCHSDAQPEFQALAYKMREAIESSTPNVLKVGEWHLPYVYSTVSWNDALQKSERFYFETEKDTGYGFHTSIENAIKISTSCCAQVSYRQLDDSLEKALKIYEMLNLPEGGKFKESPAHMSPCEHQACVHNWWDKSFIAGNFGTLNEYSRAGAGWAQYRKILENGLEQKFIQ